MDLRAQIAEALYEPPTGPSNMVKLLADDVTERRVNAVMVPVSAHVDTMAAIIEQQRREIEKLRRTAATVRFVAEHWRDVSVSTGWAIASHPLGLVLAAIDGETDVEALGLHEEDRAALERARENGGKQ